MELINYEQKYLKTVLLILKQHLHAEFHLFIQPQHFLDSNFKNHYTFQVIPLKTLSLQMKPNFALFTVIQMSKE